MTPFQSYRFVHAGLLLALAALLAACQLSERSPLRITATPAPPADVLGPFTFAPGVNPLTGLAVADPSALRRPPLAAKISNAPALVRPQAGIGQADLVFEHYVEGRLTRFTAIFWTHTPPRVGSIRSARLIDLELPAMYDTLLVYSGASEPIRQRIAALPFAARVYEGVSVGAPLYYRDPESDPPHNLFAIPAEVWERARDQGLDQAPDGLGGMAFRALPPDEALLAERLTVDYGDDIVQWIYDPASRRYARTVNGEPHRDANTGEQVTAANVVLIYAHHQEDLGIVESEWQGNLDFSIEIQIWTLGPAAILRDGRVLHGYWNRWEEEDMLSFWADEAGTEPLYLKPGNTWFQVVPLDFRDLRIE
jgi:hypothetical protein